MDERAVVVLVVDDDPAVRWAQKRVLERAGYRVTTAEDGLAALQVLRSESVQLVVTDVAMPHMDGAELLGTLHDTTDLAVVVVTGVAEAQLPPVVRRCACGWLQKPFSTREFLDVIGRCCARPS